MKFPNVRKLLAEKINERKYDSFLKYDFDNDEKFLEYVHSIDPNPGVSDMIKYMKQYYKDNVDEHFDVNYDPDLKDDNNQPTPNEDSKEEIKEEHTTNVKPVKRRLPWATKFQLMFFILFLTAFPIGFLTKLYYHLIPLCLSFIIALLKKYGFIKFNKDYWFNIVTDDHLHNLIEVLIAAFTFSGTISIWLPLLLCSILFVAECTSLIARNGSVLAKIVNRYTAIIASNREALLKFKAELDIYIGFYLIVTLVIGWVSFGGVLLYWQSLQFKYLVARNSKKAFDELGKWMDEVIKNDNSLWIARILFKGLRKIGKFMVNLILPKKK